MFKSIILIFFSILISSELLASRETRKANWEVFKAIKSLAGEWNSVAAGCKGSLASHYYESSPDFALSTRLRVVPSTRKKSHFRDLEIMSGYDKSANGEPIECIEFKDSVVLKATKLSQSEFKVKLRQTTHDYRDGFGHLCPTKLKTKDKVPYEYSYLIKRLGPGSMRVEYKDEESCGKKPYVRVYHKVPRVPVSAHPSLVCSFFIKAVRAKREKSKIYKFKIENPYPKTVLFEGYEVMLHISSEMNNMTFVPRNLELIIKEQSTGKIVYNNQLRGNILNLHNQSGRDVTGLTTIATKKFDDSLQFSCRVE